MRAPRIGKILCVGVFFLLSLSTQSFAEEYIKSFISHISVDTNATIEVTEHITVIVEDILIRHGIYRDFPIRYRDVFGNSYRVDFTLLGVWRDGQAEPYHTEELGNSIRVYIGAKDKLVPAGQHTYTISYQTKQQLGFFKDHDQLYWNVTGNGWAFVIEKAKAIILLPKEAAQSLLDYSAYTGRIGQRGKDWQFYLSENKELIFETTRQLDVGEGLTVFVSWPKGIITAPTTEQKLRYFFRENRAVIVLLCGLFIVFIYYLIVWYKFGRNPPVGTIVPLFSPPSELQAYEMRYLWKMGYDIKVFVSAILALAVKGLITIEQQDINAYTLIKNNVRDKEISQEEQLILDKLFKNGYILKLNNENHHYISEAINALQLALDKKFVDKFFIINKKFFIAGVIFSLFCILPAIVTFGGGRQFIGFFLTIWLIFWTVGVVNLIKGVFLFWKNLTVYRLRLGNKIAGGIILTIFVIPFLLGEIVGIRFICYTFTPTTVFLISLIVLLNFVFYGLLKAPTSLGRVLLDRIEGFRMYLATTEKNRISFSNSFYRKEELFEKYLPFALALDVEQQWAEQFADVFQKTHQQSGDYQPHWYHGSFEYYPSISAFTGSFSSSLTNALSSSSHPPGSSSGSSGSSGGGGGGGGGGGW
ncbi:MAG: DUF2207 domain-containing protein [Candidatus Omnitrophica bacterium]|nr:DUF2207 domain-containing protein [Candidatus Omnitrophota bacterium]